MGRLLSIPLLFALALAAAAAAPDGTTRYVAPGGDDRGGANACADPAAPCATIGQALRSAASGDTIQLAAGNFAAAGLRIDKTITLLGSGPATTTLDGGGRATLLTIAGGGTLTADGLTLRGGAGVRGGAARVEPGGRLVLRRAALLDSRADWGGGVYLAGGSLLVEDSRLAGNTAEGGGAIFAAAGTVDILRSELADNTAGVGGGLLVGPAATATLGRSILAGNTARHGGGIYVQGAFHGLNSLWRANEATGRGGGVFSDHGATLLEYTTWLGNVAALGGAVAGGGDIRLRNSLMTGSRGGDCATKLTGGDNLLDDTSCGLPARPATGLGADGRPAAGSNAIDALPPDRCRSESDGQPLGDDLRGAARPADGDGNGDGRCDIGAYEFQPRLVVVHAPTLADETRFDFGGDLGAFALTAAAPRQLFEPASGSYRLSEGREGGWKVSAIVCSGDADGGSVVDLKGRAVTVDLDSGELIRCTFTAKPTRNSIGLAVVAPGGPVAVTFSGDLGAFELRAPDAGDRRTGKMAAGRYAVQATPAAGWRVAAIACAGDHDGGSAFDAATGQALIDLDSAETLGCTFRLARATPGGRLTIRHEASPADDSPFAYTGDLGPFLLRAQSAAQTSYDLLPGVYRVHELLHPRWTLSAITCQGDEDGGTVALPEEATVSVDLDAGEDVTCVFRHIRAADDSGAITLVQTATPAEPVAFAYEGSLGAFALSLPDGGGRTWAALAPGSYTIRQLPLTGWQLDAITCSGDSDAGSLLTPAERSAVLDLDAGEAIVCSFADSRLVGSGSITIVHAPIPADDSDFRYRGTLGGFTLRAPSRPARTFTGLSAGVYSVNVRLPEGWLLSGITCEGDGDAGSAIDPTTAAVAIDLDLGEAITCRFALAGEGAPTPTPTPTPSPTPPPPPPGRRVYLPFVGR